VLSPDELSMVSQAIESGVLPLDFPEDLRQTMAWKGILLSLRLDGSPDAVALLKTLAGSPDRPDLSLLAIRFLGEQALENNPNSLDALMELAVAQQIKASIEFLQKNPQIWENHPKTIVYLFLYEKPQVFQARDPRLSALTELFFSLPAPVQDTVLAVAVEKGFKNWATVVKALLDPDTLPAFIESFPQLQEYERRLFFQFLTRAGEISRPAQNAVCQLFILYDFLPARDLALERSFLPDDVVQAALFCFLAEEWKRYEEIDFSHKLLNTAYELAGAVVRRKILTVSRATGQVEWMRNLSAGSQTRWLNELSDTEWEATVQTLLSASRCEDLWLLAQAAPPLWSARILIALDEIHWAPTSERDVEGFSNLVSLAQACRSNPYTIRPKTTWQSPAKEATAIALAADGIDLAVGSTQTAILRWQLKGKTLPAPTMFSPSPGASAMSISPDGKFLVVSNGDHKTRIFDQSKGLIVKTIEGHNGLVRAHAFQPDGRFLYTCSFDGTVQSWRFPNGVRHNLIQASKRELFGVEVAPDGRFLLCAGADKQVLVYALPEADLVRRLEGHQDTITLLTASSRGTQAASFSRDQTLKFWNYASGKEIGSIRMDDPLTSLIFHPSNKYLLGGSLQGKITLWAFPSGQLLHTMPTGASKIVGLGIDPTGNKLISACGDGNFSIWDLTLFTASRSPIDLLSSDSDSILARLSPEKGDVNSQAWAAFITHMVRWRKRYDIEVSESHPVLHLAEFDIEL